ncbi:unnamed protein product [Lepeophtheirus salmonis]|uniref:(salmon louse) hypothetical protein n=1 Tax=Lepeophtheirus salmonis TaxID=72036 RepID=A0A817FHE4_LEPSM|nr:unnamed protein product [Lepeophtheirus salmonis]CAG9478349.1 unnamed protein product [Lepeophtheirus salmonis]
MGAVLQQHDAHISIVTDVSATFSLKDSPLLRRMEVAMIPSSFPLTEQLNIFRDKGAQFNSSLWSHIMKFLGVTHSSKASYLPAANGMVERFYRQLKSALYAYSCSNLSWRFSLPHILLGIQSSLKEDIGLSSS